MRRDNALEKFQNLLRELFQFSHSDLDFGIYRILNYKRQQIEDFINNKLKEKVESAFSKYKKQKLEEVEEELKAIEGRIKELLGPQAITPYGELKEELRQTPIGKQYIELRERKEDIENIEEIQNQVFNDLYSFFSRYYEEGDFIPQPRYSIRTHKYAIPYNGEELKLHWANRDQYYVKTGILFRDYTFLVDARRVVFRTVSAREELASNKATKERFFVLDDEKPLEIGDEELIVRFQYRELTEEEVGRFSVEGGSNAAKQEKINEIISEEVLAELPPLWKIALAQEFREKTLLLHHISRFTAKNTRDYFVHKNLRGFLSEQLDYFIKAEVLDIGILEGERFLDRHITRAKVVREIADAIIEFLAQMEDFQRRLWEKKKFVLKTNYVITLDKIREYGGEEFLEERMKEILGNEKQIKEWRELFGIEVKGEGDLIVRETLEGKEWKPLPLDTGYFDEDFKLRLLEALSGEKDLDDILDGLLLKSENWQALNLLLNKYREKVQTIYIDPPFNKEQDADYLYNVKYKDSTWMSMLYDRLDLARKLLNERGSIFVRCDYNGNMFVRLLMNEIFGEENFRNELEIKRNQALPKTGDINLIEETENLYVFSKTEKFYFLNQLVAREEPVWVDLGTRPSDIENNPPRVVEGKEFYPPKYRRWAYSQENIDEMYAKGRLKLENNKIKILLDKRKLGSNWTDIPGYSTVPIWGLKTENSEILLKRVIESTSNEGDLVMDFFLGSGTTTAVAHKLKRKWIGVEMGEHFWTVVMPRMKKVLFYDKSGISKEEDVREKYNEKNAGGFFKYQVLEQYEDSLDNIELKENKRAMELFKDEYLLKYFLEFETRDSPYLLKIDLLQKPFSYKLKVNLKEVGEPEEIIVDLPETFNYLLGLKLKKIKGLKAQIGGEERKYLFILGEKDGRSCAVVWREWDGKWDAEDFKEDRNFIERQLSQWKPSIVYINGQNILTPKMDDHQVQEIHHIEPKFKELMER